MVPCARCRAALGFAPGLSPPNASQKCNANRILGRGRLQNLDRAEQPLDEIDTVTRLRHERALMPCEHVSPGALPEACPPRHPWATLPYRFLRRLFSPSARSAVPCQPWRCCAPGVLPRCTRRACTTPGAALLKPSTSLRRLPIGSPSLLTYGTHHGTIGPSLIFLFRHLNVP